ncbi:SLC13 family permease [Thalassotalea aquiviva]|uniref:SLC13 family permease n=1 Tax=Thalassotalea aquiviva TaxID=3242415 RepID=UPI00352BB8EF
MQINKYLLLISTPILAIAIAVLMLSMGVAKPIAITAAIALLCVIFWVSEPIPIPATSLLPFVLFPLFGITDHKIIASAFGSHVILLLMGAFMLSKALEKSGVHERFAVYMVNLIGVSSPTRLVLGFMLAASLLSMWISNTATVLIMLPMALAILAHVNNQRLKVALILGVAYAASLGGVGTLIGTPPNVIFVGIYEQFTNSEFGFLNWMKVGVPVVLISIPIMAIWLTRNISFNDKIIMPKLGSWRTEEIRTVWVFAATTLAWITRNEPFGGWSDWFQIPNAGDSTVALFAVVLMFAIPNGKNSRLLDWQTAKTIPWDMLILFAGGIALAKGFVASGLSELIGQWLVSFAQYPLVIMLLLLCLGVTYLTEMTSNTATATLLMPILASAAISLNIDPALLMIPAAMCASCAFMLPVATAPNAIAYGTGEVSIKEMVTEGAILSLMISVIIALVCYWVLG